MAEIASSLRQLILPKIGQELAREGGLRQWFVEGVYSASFDPVVNLVTVDDIVAADLIKFINFDYQRFALASWESFYSASLESDQLNLVGWPLLKLYYAAFFSAHAVMRSIGSSFVKINKDQIDTINYIVSLNSSGAPSLKPGMFRSDIYQVTPGKLAMRLSPHSDGTGVHEGFWRTFTDILETRSADAVTAKSVDASLFVAGVNELSPRSRGWLSARRNEINYQHRHGVWFPVDRAKRVSAAFSALKPSPSSSVSLNQSLTKDPVSAFRSTCHFLSCLNLEMAEFIAARSTVNSGFGSRWRKFQALYGRFNI